MSDYFEDLDIGARVDLGDHTFTRDEIVDFARRYDPQPFHLDEGAAAASPFGRLAASGWHTAAVWMKLYVDHRNRVIEATRARGERPPSPGPSPGFRDLKWLKPVYAGDTISFVSEVIDKRVTLSPGWGLIFHRNTGTNQHGDTVFSFDGSVLWERRPQG